jgi:hypothetical protein
MSASVILMRITAIVLLPTRTVSGAEHGNPKAEALGTAADPANAGPTAEPPGR